MPEFVGQLLKGSHAAKEMAPMIGTETGAMGNLLSMQQTAPILKDETKLSDVDQLLQDYSMLNEQKSREFEQEMNPELAAMREEVPGDLLSYYRSITSGNLPAGVQRTLAQAGLENFAATGMQGGPGTKGASALTEVLGRGSLQYQDQVRDLMTRYLTANPQESVGLDPGSAANLMLTRDASNRDLANAGTKELLQNMFGANANRQKLSQGLGEASVNESMQNAAATKQLAGTLIGALTKMTPWGAVASVLTQGQGPPAIQAQPVRI